MKEQTTERSRNVLNLGMDIYGGSAICLGPNNIFTHFYNSSPVGITVEGSNTLTRGLIIFGQGLNKSHPHIYNIFDSIQNNDLDNFSKNFNLLAVDVVKLYLTSLVPNFSSQPINRLEKLTIKFANLTNFIALLGGQIKSKQMISGSMADILSNIYLAYSLIWFHSTLNTSLDTKLNYVRDYCIERLCDEAEDKLNTVIDNYPDITIRTLLYPTKINRKSINFSETNKLYDFIKDNQDVNNILKSDLYYDKTLIEKLEKLEILEYNSEDYNKLYQDIISVGEYDVKNI
jgi:acyl-CoA dehydrogenase